MRGPRKFFSEGSDFDNVLLVDEGREDLNTTISGPMFSQVHGGPILNAGLVALWCYRGSGPVC